MKKFITPVLSLCFLISCSSDDTVVSTASSDYERPNFVVKNITGVSNVDNGYDYVGKFHAEVLQDYLINYDTEITLSGIISDVDAVAINNTDYLNIAAPYNYLSFNHVKWVLDNMQYPENIIDAAALSVNGKNMVEDFVDKLDDFETMDYTDVYAEIIGYEAMVQASGSLNIQDKKIILIVTAIARYSINADYPKKRSWGSTKSGIIAALGAVGPADAVTLSVAVNMATD